MIFDTALGLNRAKLDRSVLETYKYQTFTGSFSHIEIDIPMWLINLVVAQTNISHHLMPSAPDIFRKMTTTTIPTRANRDTFDSVAGGTFQSDMDGEYENEINDASINLYDGLLKILFYI